MLGIFFNVACFWTVEVCVLIILNKLANTHNFVSNERKWSVLFENRNWFKLSSSCVLWIVCSKLLLVFLNIFKKNYIFLQFFLYTTIGIFLCFLHVKNFGFKKKIFKQIKKFIWICVDFQSGTVCWVGVNFKSVFSLHFFFAIIFFAFDLYKSTCVIFKLIFSFPVCEAHLLKESQQIRNSKKIIIKI